jgi:hypothetical protein
MSRFNEKSKGGKTITTNLAGGKAYKQSAKLELVSLLLTSFVQDQFYRKADASLDRMAELLKQVDPKFAAKAAIFARTKFGMRSISHATAAELAKHISGQEWGKDFYNKVIYRPDDMTETLSYYYGKLNGKSVPNSLKKGFAKAFEKFDSYQLSKYREDGKEVSLIDVVNLVSPKASDKNGFVQVDKTKYVETLKASLENAKRKKNQKRFAELSEKLAVALKTEGETVSINALEALVYGMLKSTETWEAKLTNAGQVAESETEKAELKKEAWTSLISTRKIGYLALLRNLRNIIQQAPESVGVACDMLRDEKLIKKQLIMPFQFYVAIGEIEKIGNDSTVRKVLEAIDDAMEISVSNVPKFDGETLVVCDYSGSMDNKLSAMGTISYRQVGTIFGAIMAKANNADFMIFGSRAAYAPFSRKDSISTIIKQLDKHNRTGMGWNYKSKPSTNDVINVDHGTDFPETFKTANKKYDRIIYFSDLQGWRSGGAPTGAHAQYNAKYGANPIIYSFDLAGQGSGMFPEHKTYALAGFSDKVFDILKKLEQDRNALVNAIEEVEL